MAAVTLEQNSASFSLRETGGHEHSSEFHTILFFTPSGLIQADIPHLSLPAFHCNYGESESVIVW